MTRSPALYLLLDIDVPWIADGVRDRGDRRGVVQQLFLDTLERFRAPYVVISGEWSTRYSLAVQYIAEGVGL